MLYGLKGVLHLVNVTSVVLNVNNSYYEILLPNSEGLVKGEEIFLYIHEVIREDEHFLIGFCTKEEQLLFKDLIKVVGIGPKTAVGILTATSPERFNSAIIQEDLYYLKKLPGVGAKSASQLILDLKGKLQTSTHAYTSKKEEELLQALTSLGFKKGESSKIIKKIYNDKLSINELLKLALSEFRTL